MPEEKKPEGIFAEPTEPVKPVEPAKVAIPREFIRKKKSPFLVVLIIIVVLLAVVVLAQIFISPLLKEKLPVEEAPAIGPSPEAIRIIDTDGDGLTDEEERNLGTDINSPDSDNDGLFDYEEAKVYGTDPLNPDTDGDGYKDGEELKAGYDPKDPSPTAKLFDFEKEREKSE